jgi:hypothetical protein
MHFFIFKLKNKKNKIKIKKQKKNKRRLVLLLYLFFFASQKRIEKTEKLNSLVFYPSFVFFFCFAKKKTRKT